MTDTTWTEEDAAALAALQARRNAADAVAREEARRTLAAQLAPLEGLLTNDFVRQLTVAARTVADAIADRELATRLDRIAQIMEIDGITIAAAITTATMPLIQLPEPTPAA
ncbi:hypothetical protein [Sphingomonas melonis]|uniref:hypothetical protein n=1 Tax=Sphingomonas melonis TaxID=152682 RepID=UPI0035C7C3D7